MNALILFLSTLFAAYHPPVGKPEKVIAPHCAVKMTDATKESRPQLRGELPELRVEPVYGKRASGMMTGLVARVAPLTSAELAALNGQAFVDAIATAAISDMYPLWTYDASTPTAVSPDRANLVIDAIFAEQSGDPVRLSSLLNYLQIAFFHAFYEPAVTYDAALKNRATDAVLAVANRTDFLSEGNSQINNLRYRWSIVIDSVDGTHRALNTVENLLNWFRNSPTAADDYYARATAFNIFFTLARQVQVNAPSGSSSPWYNLIPSSLMTLIRDYAMDLNYTEDTLMIVENAIYTLGNFSVLDTTTVATAHAAISDAHRTHVRLDSAWLRTVTDLNNFYNATLSDGTILNIDGIKAELSAVLLPNEYVFDQGRITFKSSLPIESVEALLDAMHEVRAQFFRQTTFLDPVPGDDNENLTLVVYGSPADYQAYQGFLYDGLPTNNGGIYIETMGTLFTYDRTEEESFLTLEELLRHEYVHYLAARYLIVPSFGGSPMYDNERLTWINEGLAEWLAGSTRANGVLPRSSYIEYVADSRRTLAETIDITYSAGFDMYINANMLFTYLGASRPDLLLRLFDAIRGNDPAIVDALYNEMQTDSGLQTSYDAYIDTLLAQIQGGTGLFAEDVPTVFTPASLPYNNLGSIQSSLSSYLPVSNITSWSDRYQATGELTLAINGNSEAGIQDQFEAQLDQILVNLQSQGSNFTSSVAWFGNLTMTGGTARTNFVVEGPFNGTGASSAPPATPANILPAVVDNSVVLYWDANTEPDLSGYRVYRSQTSGGPYTQIAETTDTNFTDSGLPAGSFYYVLTAYSPSGESPFTSEIGTIILNTSTRLALHRYWDNANTDHFYTTDFSLYGNGDTNMLYEGIECYMEGEWVPGALSFNRYWNAGIGDHFYTLDWNTLGAGNQFWIHEGFEGYAYSFQATGTVPLYRYWNAAIGDHFYTVNFGTLGNGNPDWLYEGVAAYVYTSP